jgi:hypothetical protein
VVIDECIMKVAGESMLQKIMSKRYFIGGFPIELILWCILFLVLLLGIVWMMAKRRNR